MSRSLACALRAVVVVVGSAIGAGCGSVETNHLADAPAGSGDAPAVDASTTGAITVQVISEGGSGAPTVGAQVLFIDSARTQRTVTDGSGVATATIEGSATVTVIGDANGEDSETLLQTVYGAKNGDHIVLGETFASTEVGQFTINFTPAATPLSYRVYGPCGEGSVGSNSAVIDIQSSCMLDPMEILIVGTSATSGVETAYIDKPGVPFVAGGSATITDPFQPVINLTASYADTAVASEIEARRFVPDDFGDEETAEAQVSGGTVEPLTMTGPATASIVIESDISRTGFGPQTVLQKLAGSSSTYSLDVETSVLPWLQTPTFDTATETLSETPDATDSSGDASDIFYCIVQYEQPLTADAGTQTGFEWILFAATPGDLVLPALPTDLAAYLPAAATMNTRVECGELESDQLAGWDQARQSPYTAIDGSEAVRDVTGRTRFSVTQSQNDTVAAIARARSRARSSRRLVPPGVARAR